MELSELAVTPEQTEQFGGRLSRAMPDIMRSAWIVTLSGDLGAGKTTLTRGFLRDRGFTGTVKSPTYTLLECYLFPRLTVIHLDLYRLREPSELEALGLRDYDQPGYLWIVEWPERGVGALPNVDVSISLQAGTDGHWVTAVSESGEGALWLAKAGPPAVD